MCLNNKIIYNWQINGSIKFLISNLSLANSFTNSGKLIQMIDSSCYCLCQPYASLIIVTSKSLPIILLPSQTSVDLNKTDNHA